MDKSNEEFDGHMTLYKFTTNWRFCFGTINDIREEDICLYGGKTPEEAMKKALKELGVW